MFLALKEMKYLKGRYLLIIGVIALIFYLVFFLTGLAYGLAQANRSAIDQFGAKGVIISSLANENIPASIIDQNDLTRYDDLNTEPLTIVLSNVYKNGEETADMLINIAFLKVNRDSQLIPDIIEGRSLISDGEAVVSITLKHKEHLLLNDTIKDSVADKVYRIVGFTDNAEYNTLPAVYVDRGDENMVSALVIMDKNPTLSNGSLVYLTIDDVIGKLPGYQAQVLTFGLMIAFLSGISAIIIGIFMYILTIQKRSSFGIIKAQGISNIYIITSVTVQTLSVVLAGLLVGFILNEITAIFLPDRVPFAQNYMFYLFIAALTVVFALLGALFSVHAVAKIDPLEAI